MLHLLISLSLAASPQQRCEGAVRSVSRTRVAELSSFKQVVRQGEADEADLRRADQRCAAWMAEAPEEAGQALGSAAYARGMQLRDARGVPANVEPTRLALVREDWALARERWQAVLALNPNPELRRQVQLELITLELELEELSRPRDQRVAWTEARIGERALAARTQLAALSEREICVSPGEVVHAATLLSLDTASRGWFIDDYSGLLAMEEAYAAAKECDPGCLNAVDQLSVALAQGSGSWLELDDAVLTARVSCQPDRLPELVLETAALSAAAAYWAREAQRAAPLEGRSLNLRAAALSAEARRLNDTARLFGEAYRSERLPLISQQAAQIPALELPKSWDLARDEAVIRRMRAAVCVPTEQLQELAGLLFLAEPMAAVGVLSTEGAALVQRFEAMNAPERCGEPRACMEALGEFQELKVSADPTLSRAAFDSALVQALKRKARALDELEVICALPVEGDPRARAAHVSALASAYEEFAGDILASTIPPYLTGDQVEIYRLYLADRAEALNQKSGQAAAMLQELDPQRASRQRSVEPSLAAQERAREQIVQNFEIYGQRTTPRSGSHGSVRAELVRQIKELKALVADDAGCLSEASRGEAAELFEVAEMVLNEEDASMYADLEVITSDLLLRLREEVQRNCGAAP